MAKEGKYGKNMFAGVRNRLCIETCSALCAPFSLIKKHLGGDLTENGYFERWTRDLQGPTLLLQKLIAY